jgi:hypothetical protein
LQNGAAVPPSLKKLGDAVRTTRAKLEQVGPSTLITLGATALFITVVGVIFYVNRVAPKPSPLAIDVAKTETVAGTEHAGEASPRFGGDNRVRADAPKNGAARAPNGGNAKPAESAVNSKAEAAVPGVMGANGTQAAPAAASPQPPAPAPQPRAAPVPAPKPEPSAAAAGAAAVAATAAVAKAATDQAPAQPATTSEDAEAPVVAADTKRVDPTPTAAPKPSPNRIAQAELTTLLRKFAFTYEAGDIEQFMGLFDDDVRTNDRASKAGLREDYEGLFQNSVNRQMLLGNVAWEISDRQANGWGNFEVRIKRAGDEEVKTYKGSLTFYVEKIDGRLRIKRMYHGQYRAGG